MLQDARAQLAVQDARVQLRVQDAHIQLTVQDALAQLAVQDAAHWVIFLSMISAVLTAFTLGLEFQTWTTSRLVVYLVDVAPTNDDGNQQYQPYHPTDKSTNSTRPLQVLPGTWAFSHATQKDKDRIFELLIRKVVESKATVIVATRSPVVVIQQF